MTREEFTKEVDKILEEVSKKYTILSKEVDEGYVPHQCHYRIREIPDWLFAIWDVTDLDNYEGGLYTFCEHNNLLDKFKVGRCYNDATYTSLGNYINSIEAIVYDEAYAFYQSDFWIRG